MNKEFIPYEQALELKELGFDEPCFANYNPNFNLYHSEKNYLFNLKGTILENNECKSPTFSQAFKWFREKHKIESFVNSYWSEEDSSKRSYYANYNYGSDIFFTIDKACKSHEEAELECLKKLIEIIKK